MTTDPWDRSPAAPTKLDADWLRDFYKECGREVTLAYTTLNQMKNWAIVVQGSIIAAVASFSRSLVTSSGNASILQFAFPVGIGAVLAYVFTLRFFVRAILCYINLSRWNTLQSVIVQYKLLPKAALGDASRAATTEELERAVRQNIENYYHRWLSPLSRTGQIASNLKLGFGILMAIPVLLMIWAGSLLWRDSLLKGLIAFAVGATVIEGFDFLASSYFDTPQVAELRRERREKRNAERTVAGRKEHSVFPAPSTPLGYIFQWVVILIVSALVALWPWISVWLYGFGPLPLSHQP